MYKELLQFNKINKYINKKNTVITVEKNRRLEQTFFKRHPKPINMLKHMLISNWEMPMKTSIIYH